MFSVKARICGIAAAILGYAATAGVARAEPIYAVTQQGFLVSWDSSTPSTLLSGVAIQGLQSNETLVGIDFRPADNVLYGLGSFSRLYTIDVSTGVSTLVGDPNLFTPKLNGSNFGFDFNPVVDLIREVSNVEQNLRLNPNTGGVAAVDTALAYAAADPNFGVNPNVSHAAYANNVPNAVSTTLYTIDAGLDVLAIQSPPNAGTLNTVGSLGINVTELGGFDISGVTGIAYAALQPNNSAETFFYTIDLSSGSASLVGKVSGGLLITAMTVAVPEVGTLSLAAIGVTAIGLVTIRRRRAAK